MPPKVEPCIPAPMTWDAFSPHRQAPKGSPPASPLAEVNTSGRTPNCCIGVQCTGAAYPCLHLVEQQQQLSLPAKRGRRPNELGIERDDPALPLDRLKHQRAGMVARLLPQIVKVAGLGIQKALGKGIKVLVKGLLPRRGQGGYCAPVKGVAQRDNPIPARAVTVKAVFAGDLDGALVGLRPRVAKKGA